MKASDFFTFPKSLPFGEIFDHDLPPWEWIPLIKKALSTFDFSKAQEHPHKPPHLFIGPNVFIDPTAILPPYGCIEGPAYIGPRTEIRAGVYIRGNVIVGEGCVLGNSCEYKNSLLMDRVQTAHFHYVGDSILGTGTHLGAGVILSNVRLDKQPVLVQLPNGERLNSGLVTFGSIIGEYAEIGCNAVLLPGTLIGKRAKIYPCISIGGYIPQDANAKLEHKPKIVIGS
jgi:UDP-N-acetylglucosamine diphosphorylase / glucose-1-phosphate thymidylyltransferase / UDP-N-acetylgalactosamine diphosphorylase / glucosamine-1-phosphate N-acetyltransferase / galactosamine-1-phosphate N-acetyltransferase